MTSSRPYLVRALYEWINDNTLTPYILVDATHPEVSVPQQYVNDGKIVLNIAPNAIYNLLINNSELEFDASFRGYSHHIFIPMDSLLAIYPQEKSNSGMVFGHEPGGDTPPDNSKHGKKKQSAKKPHLTIIKN